MRFWLIILLWSQVAQASNFGSDTRSRYLAEAIASIEKLELTFVKDSLNFVDLVARQCGSSFVEIKVRCMLETGQSYCQQKAQRLRQDCHRLIDILLANRSHESQFLSKRERYEIMRDHKNFRRIFDQRLAQKYGALTTSYVMSPYFACRDKHKPCFVAGLDQFCQNMSEEGKLSWNTCTAAIVWFIARPNI